MIRNYLTIAVRQLVKQRVYTVLNILGLAVGMACSLLVIQFIREELRIGSDNTHADRIYRVLRQTVLSGTGKRVSRGSSGGLRQAAIASIPEIDIAVRVPNWNYNWIRYGETLLNRPFTVTDPEFLDMFDIELVSGDPATIYM